MSYKHPTIRFIILSFIILTLLAGCQNSTPETNTSQDITHSTDQNQALVSNLEQEPLEDMTVSLESTLDKAHSTYLTKTTLSYLSLDLLGFLKNEIMARHGYIFNSPLYQDYFENQAWYTANTDYKESDLNDFEQYNVLLIAEVEADLKKAFVHEADFDVNQLPNTLELRQILGSYLMAKSNTQLLTTYDLLSFIGSDDLNYVESEIEARHGKIFDSQSLNTYFESRPWYQSNDAYQLSDLSEIEKHNLEFIHQINSQVANYSDLKKAPENQALSSDGLEDGAYFIHPIETPDSQTLTFTTYTQYLTIWSYNYVGKDYLDHNCPVLVFENGKIKRLPIQELTSRLDSSVDMASWAKQLNQNRPYHINGLKTYDSDQLTLKVSSNCQISLSTKASQVMALDTAVEGDIDLSLLLDAINKMDDSSTLSVLIDVQDHQITSISIN